MENKSNNIVDQNFSDIKLENVKMFVDNHLDKLDLFKKLKNIVEEDKEDTNEEQLIAKLRQEGLIDEIVESFKGWKTSDNEKSDSRRKCLFLKLESGKDFIDFSNLQEKNYFQFDILFLGQRFKSKQITCASDFYIDQTFLFDFNPLRLDIDLDLDRLKKLSSHIHIVLIKIEGEEKTLIATKSLEWRWALCYGSWKIEAEFYSPATLNKLNVGTVEVYNKIFI